MTQKSHTIVTHADLEQENQQTLKDIGVAEATKKQAEQKDLNTGRFENLVKENSTKTLLRVKTIKLLDFFPDEITIDINKVNVSKRNFFLSRHLHTIPIENIQDVFVEMTPFYATVKIVDKGFVDNTIEVQFLKKEDAKRTRRIIQGLITAYKDGVELASLSSEGLVEKLETLGSAGDVESVKG